MRPEDENRHQLEAKEERVEKKLDSGVKNAIQRKAGIWSGHSKKGLSNANTKHWHWG
jgi:hypothetical protein